MSKVVVLRSIWIDTTLERGWCAVTEGEQLSKWYSPGSPWEIPDLNVGAKVYFHHSPNAYHQGTEVVTMSATIVGLEQLRRFAVSWEFETEEHAMITTFLLEEENGGVRVSITETGYETPEQAKPTEEGYAMSLENLKAFIEGRSLPY